MSANATTESPKGRKKLARGKDAAPAADAALFATRPFTLRKSFKFLQCLRS